MKPPRPVSQRADYVGPDHVKRTTRHTALGQAHRGVSRGGQIGSRSIAARGFVSTSRKSLFPDPATMEM